MLRLIALLALAALPARACDTALLLTIDVSNSVDISEYQLQAVGLADSLQDLDIIEALVRGESTVAVMQWSGTDKQELTIPWTRIRTAMDVERLSMQARLMPRAFILSDTAPAAAIRFALRQFDQITDCDRKVIDISGDGTPNAGGDTRAARRQAQSEGVTINAIAIESMGLAITNFYRTTVITRDGFVMTARRHRDYPRAIRAKILRELTKAIS